jgi:hypothetical protein
MSIFLSGCALLIFALLLHVVVWKTRLPRNHTKALLLIFLGTLIIWITVAFLTRLPFLQTLHSGLFFISLALCYVITYSAIEGDSPTLSLMRFLDSKHQTGATREEVDAFFASRPFIRSRLDALIQSSLVKESHGRFYLAGHPSLPFRCILYFRKIFGSIPKGG